MQLTAGLELGQQLFDPRLHLYGEFHQRPTELLGNAAQHPGARVLGAVDGVTESHDPVAAQDAVTNPGVDAVGCADGVEHVQGPAGRTAVQRPGERADGTDEAGREVGAGGGDDPCGEGRGIEAVVDGGDQICLDRPHLFRLRHVAGEHVEVVGGVTEIRARLDGLLSLAEPVERGDQGRYGGAGGERIGATAVGVDVIERPEAGRRTEQRERSAQPGERAGERTGTGECGQRVTYGRRQRTQSGGLRPESSKLRRVGQLAVQHQVPDVLEGAGRRQLDGGVLAVVVKALDAPDVTQLGLGDDDARKPTGRVDRCVRLGARHGCSPRSSSPKY